MKHRFIASFYSPIIFAFWVGHASAQEGGQAEPNYGDIVVTAQKRSESILAVPATISAFDDQALARTNSNTLENLSVMVPGVQFATTEGNGQISIRGIGNQFILGAAEAAVATHVDGFYVARLNGIVGSFLDVERVEVLKGPQGTLYGRNATSGTINIINKKPTDELSASVAVDATYIDRGDGTGHGAGFKASAVLNMPINDRIKTRVAVMKISRDGYYKGYYPNGDRVDLGDADEFYVRAMISADFSDRLNWLVATDNYWADDRGAFINIVGQANPNLPLEGVRLGYQTGGRTRRIFLDSPISSKPKQNAFTSTLTWEANDALTLRSLTQYRYNRYHIIGEFDGTQAPISKNDYAITSREFTQELQGILDVGRLKATFGAFYFQEKIKQDQFFLLVPTFQPNFDDGQLFLNGSAKTKAYAVFADLTYALTDTLDFTLGGRYSIEDRSGVQDAFLGAGFDTDPPAIAIANDAVLPRKRYKAFTPKAVLNYRPNSDLTFFISAQKGFKSGAYNIGSLGQNAPFKPEKIKSIEVGTKSRFLDRRIGVNLSAFYYDYTDLQAETTELTQTVITNAAGARIKGFEWETYFQPTPELRIDFNGAILDAKFTKGILTNPIFGTDESIKGNRLFRTSKYSGSVGITYTAPMAGGGTLSPNFTASYRSKQYFTAFNDALPSQNGYWWLRASLTYRSPDRDWSIALYGDNLTNKYVLTSAIPISPAYGSPLQGAVLPPRVFGLKFDKQF